MYSLAFLLSHIEEISPLDLISMSQRSKGTTLRGREISSMWDSKNVREYMSFPEAKNCAYKN